MKEKIVRYIKIGLFISMLILTYFASNEFINFIMQVDVETLKRVLNIILIVIITVFSLKDTKPVKKH